MFGNFWGSSGLAVMLPNFYQNCGLRISITCLYVFYPWAQCICDERGDIKYYVKKRNNWTWSFSKEGDPQKLWDPSILEARGQTRSLQIRGM